MKKSFPVVASCLLCLISSVAFSQKQKLSSESYLNDLFNASPLFDTTRVVAPAVAVIDSLNDWKSWKTVDNFSFGKNRGSLPMIADLSALHPFFRDKITELVNVCKKAGITLAVVETYRTPSKQAEYFAMGEKYTSTPGGKSRHQYGLAIDVVPVVDSVAVWNNHKLWRKIGIAGERLGLRWGGRWKVLYDPGHFEWTGGLSRHDLAKGLFPKIPASEAHKYPRIDEDLKRLRDFWEAWEAEQAVIANGGDGDANSVVSNR